MFKILWDCGQTTIVQYHTVQQAVDWGAGTGRDFCVIDEQGRVRYTHLEPVQVFTPVSGLTYRQARRMSRE